MGQDLGGVSVSSCADLIAWLNLVALVTTGAVIVWYTVETSWLRKEAQKQTELETRPFLSLSRRGDGLEVRFFVVNVGKGMARNVTLDDIRIDASMELHPQPITHIAPGEDALPTWHVWVALPGLFEMSKMPSKDADQVWPANHALASNEVTVLLTYASMVGQRYRTSIRLRNGLAEIGDDQRIP